MGTAWTQVPLWALLPALLALSSATSQKKTHYCCPMRKTPSSFRPHQGLGIFSTVLLSPLSSNFHLCDEGADEKLQEGPHKTQAPSWPWQGQPAVGLGQGGLGCARAATQRPWAILYFPMCAHWMGKSLGGLEKRVLPPLAGSGEQGLGEGSDMG